MKKVNDANYYRQRVLAALETFECEGIIIIPVYAPDNIKYPDLLAAPVLYGNLDTDTVDNILDTVGKSARKNIRERKKEKVSQLPTDLTPTFHAPRTPTA